MTKIITSLTNDKVKYLTKLYKDSSFRRKEGLYIVEGYNLVDEALNTNMVSEIFISSSSKYIDKYKDATFVTDEIINKITDTVQPEGIVATVKFTEKRELSPNIIYLDRIQDPGNLGTILRSAVAFGFNSVILDNSVDLYNPKTIRSSLGAIYKLSFPKYNIDELKSLGYEIITTTMKGKNPKDYTKTKDKICLILGNEGNGVRPDLTKLSDINLTIPMINTESLNVGVAGSILMYILQANLKNN